MPSRSILARIVGLGLGLGLVLWCSKPLVAQPSAPTDSTTASTTATAWADSVLETLSLRERAAQMVWPNLIGDYTATDDARWIRLRHLITQEKVGGVLISVGSPMEIVVKLNALQRLSSLPLLVSADLETGAGMRARGGYFVPNAIDLGGATWFPPNMAFGAADDTTLTYWAGRITAREGRALGIHVNFAPVLDVNNNPANPVINTRSYSDRPDVVARHGVMFIRGVQDGGMIATAKHFPGHGDTDVNSHLALPVVTASRARLDSVELVPFRAGIAAGVGAVMTFHGAMPALDDSGLPGTLSSKVNTDLLRTQLGFHGLIVSDAMDMRGVLDQYGTQGSVQRAVAAGVDILIQPVDATEAIDAIVAGIAENLYSEDRITQAARRILMAKHRLGLHRERFVAIDSVRQIVGRQEHWAIAQAVADKSITVPRSDSSVFPLRPGQRVLSVTVANRADLAAGTTFNAVLEEVISRDQNLTLQTAFVAADDPNANYEALTALTDSADVVIVSSYVGQRWNVASVSAPPAFANWINAVSQQDRGRATADGDPKLIVVAFGNPYLIEQIPTVSTYIIAWGGAPVSQRAAANMVAGTNPP